MHGELINEEDIVWRPTQRTFTKTVIGLNNENNVYHIQETISDNVRSSIDLEETGAEGNPEYVRLRSADVFNVISSVAREHFQTVPVDPNWNTQVENERLVRVLDDQGVQRDMQIKVKLENLAVMLN